MNDHDDQATTEPATPPETRPSASRRAVLLGVGAAGAAGLIAACGTNGATPQATPSSIAPTTPEVMKTEDIPVGGGMVYKNANVVVTQPVAGTYKAFDATCRHLGCQVGTVADGKIKCPCHGSQYNVADGTVFHGPATSGLPEKKVALSGDIITVS